MSEEGNLQIQSGEKKTPTDYTERESLDILPDKALYAIFDYIDVFHLCQLKTVSKKWLNTIDRAIQENCKWYEKCVKDIPDKYWISLLEHHTNGELPGSNFHDAKMHSGLWISLYKSWKGWKSLVNKEPYIINFDNIGIGYSEPISALCASNNIVAIGIDTFNDEAIETGFIEVYDVNQLDEGPILMRGPEDGPGAAAIKEIHIWRKDDNVIIISCDATRVEKWKIKSSLDWIPEFKVDLIGEYPLISTNLGYCYTMTKLKESSDDGSNAIKRTLTVERLSTEMHPPITLTVVEEKSNVYDIMAVGDKVLLMFTDVSNNVMRINEYSSNRKEARAITTFDYREFLRYYYHSVRLFKPCVVACATEDGSHVGFIVNNKPMKHYEVSDLLGNYSVRSICYHVGLLIFGTECGEIIIISVGEEDRLYEIDLDTMDHQVEQLNSGPITHLAVTEHNFVQYILATSYTSLNILKFS